MKLVVNGISKYFKSKKAVDNVSLTINPGVWGLLGANGAGKTTLIRIIAGIMKPDAGEVLYDGVPIHNLQEKYRNILGYLPQNFGFDPDFTVSNYLEYIAALKGLTSQKSKIRIAELSERLTLTELKNNKISKLSGGMRQRVGIAQALLNEPEVLILDEPTSGLDPGERIRFRNLLSEFARDRIVLISTHIVSDVESIAFMNTVIKNGKLIAAGTTEELVTAVENKVWSVVVPVNELHKYDKTVRIVNVKNEDKSNVSIRYIADGSIGVDSKAEAPCLEDLYLWMFPQENY